MARDLVEDAAHLMFDFMRRPIGVASGDFRLWLVDPFSFQRMVCLRPK